MLRSLAAYVRQHHLALLALFVALGGTSVAATSALLPRNSVGTAQLKRGAVTKAKIARKTLKALHGQIGPRGPQGIQGIQGIQGPKGDKGDPTYKRTILVSPVGTDAQNGAALLEAVANANPTAASPYLLKIEPGTYDVGNQVLQLKQHLDVEGSGWPTVVTGQAFTTVAGVSGDTFRDIGVTNIANSTSVHEAFYAGNVTGLDLQNVELVGDNSGGLGIGLFVSAGPPGGGGTKVIDSVVDGQGGTGAGAYGVLVEGSPSGPGVLQMDHSSAQGFSSGGDGIGVSLPGESQSATIKWSDLRGNFLSLEVGAGGFAQVGLSFLYGPVDNLGSLQCGGDLNEADYTSLGPSCA